MAREMRGGLKGFTIALVCLVVSSLTLTTSHSLVQSLTHQLQRQGRTILGGDAELRRVHTPFSAVEKNYLKEKSQKLSLIARMRVMAQTATKTILVELKAVDRYWPLIGNVALVQESSQNINLQQALKPEIKKNSPASEKIIYGAVASPALLSSLDINIGDVFSIGNASFQLRARLENEPDGLADGIAIIPRLIVSTIALKATQLVQPASLITYQARVILGRKEGLSNQFANNLKAAFPDLGARIRTHRDSSPVLRRFIGHIAMFLTLTALTSFLVSGIGIANAVSTWFKTKQSVIATMKCLGASSALITRVYLAQILLMACLGIFLGTAIGLALPFTLSPILASFMPLPFSPELNFSPVGIAIVYGLLITLLFSLIPLALAKSTPPSHLLRAHIVQTAWLKQIHPFWWVAIIGLALTLFALVLWLSPERAFALYFLSGAVASLALLYAIGSFLILILRLYAKTQKPIWRVAVANVIRPGAQSQNIIMALGLGLALLSAIALLDAHLRYQIDQRLPQRAPSFFIAELALDQLQPFKTFLAQQTTITDSRIVPLLRGQIIKIKGKNSALYNLAPNIAWVLNGDRGLTYVRQIPKGTRLVKGKWWDENYQGPPLLSISEDVANGIGLELGDTITINLLGQKITSHIANIRQVNWAGGGMRFVLIFSPQPFQKMPVHYFATLHVQKHALQSIRQKIAKQFPDAIIFQTNEILDVASDLMKQISNAARFASFWTLITGILVLIASMIASAQLKLTESVIFKVLGAKRSFIAKASAVEYLLLGLAAALAASVIGALGAFTIITFLWKTTWMFLANIFFLTIIGAMTLVFACGLAIHHRALAQKPAPWLRQIS